MMFNFKLSSCIFGGNIIISNYKKRKLDNVLFYINTISKVFGKSDIIVPLKCTFGPICICYKGGQGRGKHLEKGQINSKYEEDCD